MLNKWNKSEMWFGIYLSFHFELMVMHKLTWANKNRQTFLDFFFVQDHGTGYHEYKKETHSDGWDNLFNLLFELLPQCQSVPIALNI